MRFVGYRVHDFQYMFTYARMHGRVVNRMPSAANLPWRHKNSNKLKVMTPIIMTMTT